MLDSLALGLFRSHLKMEMVVPSDGDARVDVNKDDRATR
jgi:hypothetical protein